MDGNFLGLGLEYKAAHTDDIADVVLAEIGKLLLGHVVLANVKLDKSAVVLDMAENRLAHAALGHDSSRDLNGLAVKLVVVILDLGRICAS